MLTVTNLSSGYAGSEILHGINVTINLKEIVAIIGPNGCGKSTFLKSIFNVCDIISGKIVFNNTEITKKPASELIQLGISYVPQGRIVFSDLTVEENLEMGAFLITDKKLIRERLQEMYAQFPILAVKKNDYAFTLSGGQQQILAISRALIQKPKVLLLDEPSLGLSPKMADEVFEYIKKINKAGVTVIIVEQNAKKAVSLAHTTYVFESGNVMFKGGKEILKNKKLRNIYFGGE